MRGTVDESAPEYGVRFCVEGDLPPKKDGANSMWLKPTEVRRLVRLRHAAHDALRGVVLRNGEFLLRIEIRCPNPTVRTTGDLDNFVTGVCDGLQRADPKTPWQRSHEWTRPENADISPDRFRVIDDDASIVQIDARKRECATPGYDVEIGVVGRH